MIGPLSGMPTQALHRPSAGRSGSRSAQEQPPSQADSSVQPQTRQIGVSGPQSWQ